MARITYQPDPTSDPADARGLDRLYADVYTDDDAEADFIEELASIRMPWPAPEGA